MWSPGLAPRASALRNAAGTFLEPYPFVDKKHGKKCRQAIVTLWCTLIEKLKHEVKQNLLCGALALRSAPRNGLERLRDPPTSGRWSTTAYFLPALSRCFKLWRVRYLIPPLGIRAWYQCRPCFNPISHRAGASWRAPHGHRGASIQNKASRFGLFSHVVGIAVQLGMETLVKLVELLVEIDAQHESKSRQQTGKKKKAGTMHAELAAPPCQNSLATASRGETVQFCDERPRQRCRRSKPAINLSAL